MPLNLLFQLNAPFSKLLKLPQALNKRLKFNMALTTLKTPL